MIGNDHLCLFQLHIDGSHGRICLPVLLCIPIFIGEGTGRYISFPGCGDVPYLSYILRDNMDKDRGCQYPGILRTEPDDPVGIDITLPEAVS